MRKINKKVHTGSETSERGVDYIVGHAEEVWGGMVLGERLETEGE